MKKLIFKLFPLLVFVFLVSGMIVYRNLSLRINRAIQSGWFPPSVSYYSAPFILKNSQKFSFKELKKELIQRNYTPQSQFQNLKPGEFIFLSQKDCQNKAPSSKQMDGCLSWISKSNPNKKNLAGFSQSTLFLYQGKPFRKIPLIELEPILFTQYEDGFPRVRKKFPLSQTPYLCLRAVTITEDQNFLLHKGASPSGIFRALIKNIKHGKIKEGGSTITQQLVKNHFTGAKKTFQRKWIELLMSLILETKLSKDEILELYLNTIYMGQAHTYSLYGLKTAANYYFNKPLIRLDAAQCSLLSAILQSPGRLNPFKYQDKALRRRNFILKKLHKENIISKKILEDSLLKPLPSPVNKINIHEAPYFIQAVAKELETYNAPYEGPLNIYTTIDLKIQKKADQAIKKTIDFLEKKQKINKPLQAGLIFLDLKKGEVLALSGGRNFLQSQFNRAIEANRQTGSLVKPFIYLTALKKLNLNPLSLVEDSPIQNAKWSPKNYKNKYYGSVPLYFALKQSLNSASARLGQKVKLSNIIQDMKLLGAEKTIPHLPSITLGSFEMSLLEVTKMYSTIARLGSYLPLTFIHGIQTDQSKIISRKKRKAEQRFSKQDTAVLIGMMRLVVESGSAEWIRPFWPHPTAGKTGTSNDERDSWFVGFTPGYLCAVWLGYDDNTPHGLTGAAGALPLWLNFMNSLDLDFKKDFKRPKGVIKRQIKPIEVHSVPSPAGEEREFFTVKTADQKSAKKKPEELIFKNEKRRKWFNFSNP